MSGLRTFLTKKTVRQASWRALNTIALFSLVFHMSALGVFLTPTSAALADEEPLVAAESVELDDSATLEDEAALRGTPVEPLPNPVLPNSCGLDIGLVLDSSGSVDSGELTAMKNAFKGFVDAFLPGTPTQLSVVEFDTNVVPPSLAFTSNITDIKNRIDAAVSNNRTNWEGGILESHGLYDPRPAKPDLMVFASDGNPNAINGDSTVSESVAMNAAILAANGAKADGIRVLALGIGNNLDIDNLKAISGTNVDTGITSDVITSDFDELAEDLADYANQLCGGKILVQKQIDTNGDGQADIDGSTPDPLLAGWTFDVDGSPTDPSEQTTTDTGSLEFDVLNGTYSVTEQPEADTILENAWCTNGNDPVGTFDAPSRTITGLVMDTDDTIACTFLNAPSGGSVTVHKMVLMDGRWQHADGDASPFRWGLDGEDATRLMGSTAEPVATGEHQVTENTVPGYAFSGWYPIFQDSKYSCENPYSTTYPVEIKVLPNQATVLVLCNEATDGTIHGHKWHDEDSDGVWDKGENGLADWVILIDGPDVHMTAITDEHGAYSVDLPAGEYVVCEMMKKNWVQTYPGADADWCHTVKVVGGETTHDVNFGNQVNEPKGEIYGYKWNDLNGNGWRDCPDAVSILGGEECEPLLSGWTIQLWQNDTLVDETQTSAGDNFGWYQFTGLYAGEYWVCEVLQEGWEQTYPKGCHLAVLDGGQPTVDDAHFGNHGTEVDLVIKKKIWDLRIGTEGPEASSVVPADTQYFLKMGYTNTGTKTATDAVVCDELASYWITPPALINNGGMFAVNAEDGPCGTPNTIWWNVGDVAPGQTGNVSAILEASTDPADYPNILQQYCGLDNTGLISIEGEGWYDVDTSDNSAWATHENVCPPIPDFNLTVSKTDGETEVAPGDTLTYTISWELTSFGEVSNAVITDYLPADVSFVTGSNGAIYNNIEPHSVSWNLGDLNPSGPDYMLSGTQTVTVTVNSPLDQGTLLVNNGTFCYNVDRLTIGGEPCVPFADTDSVLADFTLTLDKSDNADPVTPGDAITYTLAWTVSGNTMAYNATLTDTLPAELTFVSASNGGIHNGVNPAGTVTWTLGDLEPGASGSFTIVAVVNEETPGGTNIFNPATFAAEKHILGGKGGPELQAATAGASALADIEIVSVSASSDETTQVIVTPPETPQITTPVLTLDKTVSKVSVAPGEQITYTLVIKNTGNGSAENVTVTDVLPASLAYADVVGTTRSWNLGTSFSAGNSTTLSYPVIVSPTAANGSYINTATVTASNHGTVTDTATVTSVQPVVLGATTPVLTIEKTADLEVVNVGDIVTYTIEVKNTGDASATNTILKDFLPDGFEMTSDGSITRDWTIGTMQPGQSGVFVYTAKVTDGTGEGSYDNIAQVSADGLDPLQDVATVQVIAGTVLGAEVLAESGAQTMDYLLFLSGAALLFVAALGFRKSSALA